MQEPQRVAYVEDEPDIRELTEMALVSIGSFEVMTFASGPEALEGLPDFAPDVILLDVMMPEMDGPELLSRLSEIEAVRETPVIFMTARSQPEEIEEFLSLGAIGVVSKPYDPMTLSDEVRAICRNHSG